MAGLAAWWRETQCCHSGTATSGRGHRCCRADQALGDEKDFEVAVVDSTVTALPFTTVPTDLSVGEHVAVGSTVTDIDTRFSSRSPSEGSTRADEDGTAAMSSDQIKGAWRSQVMAVIKPGLSALIAGMGQLARDFHRQRKAFADPVVALLFAPPAADQAGPRSLRLSQRKSKDLRVVSGSENPFTVDGGITEEAVVPGEVEVLITRQMLSTHQMRASRQEADRHLVGGADAGPRESLDPSSWMAQHQDPNDKRIAGATDFRLTLQLPFADWLFRALVTGFQGGPLYHFADAGVTGQQALGALDAVWPNSVAFMKQIFEAENTVLHVGKVDHSCVEVRIAAPVDLKAVGRDYPKVAQILRITKSLNMTFTDHAEPLKRSKNRKSAKEDPPRPATRQALRVSFIDGEFNVRFLVCDRLLAWADEQGQPILNEQGEVETVPAPLAPLNKPRREDLRLFCRVDNVKLRLTEFGCFGFGSLSMPDAIMALHISTAPAFQAPDIDHPSDVGPAVGRIRSNTTNRSAATGWTEATGVSAPFPAEMGEEFNWNGEVLAHVVFRICDLAAFPAEGLLRPLFDIRLMRILLVYTFQASWIVCPCGPDREWQLISDARASMPRIAKAFRNCLRHFAQMQIRESDWLNLFAHLFTAISKDIALFETSLSQAKQPGRGEEEPATRAA